MPEGARDETAGALAAAVAEDAGVPIPTGQNKAAMPTANVAGTTGGDTGTRGILGEGASGANIPKDIKYSPINPGPLSDDVANNFNAATYTKKGLAEDTVMYRVHGGGAGKVGSYLSKTPQGGGLQSQLDLALNPSWGNTTENVTKVVVPKGAVIYEGTAAPQNILDSLGNIIGTLPGGGNQIYIPKVGVGWFK